MEAESKEALAQKEEENKTHEWTSKSLY
jgi:hypothetical protein